MEDIQAILNQVQQLQAENELLRSQMANQSAVHQAGQSSEASASTSASTSVNAPPVSVPTQFLYVPRERKCPKFSGKMSVDLITVEKWIEEARRCITVRHMSQSEQILFLYDHVEGGARAELDFHCSTDKDTPEKCFAILRENYSCSKSYVTAQLQFFQRSQKEGESLREFSHALKSLMDIVNQKTPGGVPNSDQILRDQFVEQVQDEMLRRELKRQISQDQAMSFTVLRGIAIKWAEEGRNISKLRPRAFSCTLHSDLGDTTVAETNAMSVQPSTELKELKECLLKQQAQLDAIMKHIGLPKTPQIPLRQEKEAKPYRFEPNGKPICIRCNKAGHIARFCRTQTQSNTNRYTGPQGTVQSSDAVDHQSWPQEN